MLEKSESVSIVNPFKYFVLLLSLFMSTWLIANIAAIKLVLIFGLTFTGAFFIFPFTLMFNTIIVEVYGYKSSRQAIWAGFILNLAFILLMNVVNILPVSPHWHHEDAFATILIPDTRIILASLLSFFISDFFNSYLMAKMKIKNRENALLKRIVFASTLSILIDIICFIVLAYAGIMSVHLLVQLLMVAFLKRIICHASLLPLMCFIIDVLKCKEKIEIYDDDTKFNPFSFDNLYPIKTVKESL